MRFFVLLPIAIIVIGLAMSYEYSYNRVHLDVEAAAPSVASTIHSTKVPGSENSFPITIDGTPRNFPATITNGASSFTAADGTEYVCGSTGLCSQKY